MMQNLHQRYQIAVNTYENNKSLIWQRYRSEESTAASNRDKKIQKAEKDKIRRIKDAEEYYSRIWYTITDNNRILYEKLEPEQQANLIDADRYRNAKIEEAKTEFAKERDKANSAYESVVQQKKFERDLALNVMTSNLQDQILIINSEFDHFRNSYQSG
jgi:hypothetical protein